MSGKFKAIFSTLGSGRGETPVDVVGTVNILDAARTEGIDRLIVVTIVGPGESILMVPEHLRESHAWAIDIKDEAEKHIMASDLELHHHPTRATDLQSKVGNHQTEPGAGAHRPGHSRGPGRHGGMDL